MKRPSTDSVRLSAFIFVTGIVIASCSEKPAPDREKNANTSEASRERTRESEAENEFQPDEDLIAEDCGALVRSTKVGSARAASPDCPGCPARGTDALSFRGMKTDSVSCSGDACTVLATIRAVFNPGSGETIAGGLTAWIPPEMRSAYLSGKTPSGEQTYRVQITYKRRGEIWQVVEFDRAPNEITTVAETAARDTTGIEGTIVVAPTRPGPIRKDEEPSAAPVSNSQFVVKAGDAIVKTFTTDGEGHFKVALPPGHYVILREGAAPMIGRWLFEADVVAGQVTKVNWTADSGMR